jgi:type I restriction enzyme M protein
VLKKNRTSSGVERAGSVLFIDASQHFEKVKTQNMLRLEDISKIIHTYENRNSEEKYSHLAPLSEIAENDYNLNIPRYVDTFEEEDAVDLTEITKELRKVAEALEATDATIEIFCKELGIETPF